MTSKRLKKQFPAINLTRRENLVYSYVMAKLTLHVPDRLVAAAKQEAVTRGTSVSKLVSDYFRAFTVTTPGGTDGGLPPITASLVGCIRGSDGDHESYVDFLERKHS